MEHTCEICGEEVNETDYSVVLMPFPHIVCPKCGHWVPCF